jgi:hypothetical protein
MALVACGQVTPIVSNFDAGPPPDQDVLVLPPTDASPPTCVNLECQQVNCGGTETTLTGKVYAPNGTLPLWDTLVYVPNAPLDPLPNGPLTDCVPVSGKPIAAAVTDPQGRFTLKNVPVGKNIPVVVQSDKWRRTIIVPNVPACQVTTLPGIALPRNKLEGDMPRIAVTSGGCDPLACLLRKIGIDSGELGWNPNGSQRVTLFRGTGGGAPNGAPDASTLWNSPSELAKYDDVLFASECDAHVETKTNPSALAGYADKGGRVLLTGSQVTWPADLVTAWQPRAKWGDNVTASAPFSVNVTYPRGKALADWLSGPEIALTPKYAEVPIVQAGAHVGAVQSSYTTRIVSATGGATTALRFNTPVNMMPDKQWGRVSYYDFATSGVVDSSFPASCTGTLTAEEALIAFQFFEPLYCLYDYGKPPQPPPPGDF